MSTITTPSTRARRRHVRRQVALSHRFSQLAARPRILCVDAPAEDEQANAEHEQESDELYARADLALSGITEAERSWANDQYINSPAMESARAWAARQ